MSKKQSVISIIKSSLGSQDLLSGMTAARIRNIRKAYKLSQVAFADLLGLKFETYASWEKARRFPSSPGCAVLMIAEKYPEVFLKRRKDIVKRLKKIYSLGKVDSAKATALGAVTTHEL
jgi:DNA-binding transcriptional regulator YiaG